MAAGASSLTLSWSPSTDNVGVAGYDAYLGSSKAGTTAATSYTYSGLTCGTSYTLGVDAYDAAGNVSSRSTISTSTSPCPSGGSGALGTQALGPASDYNPPGWAEAFPTTASASGAIAGLRVYVDGPSTASKLVAGLYADASGAPGSLIAQGSVTPTAGAWNNVPLSGVTVSSGTTYWIAILGPAGSLYYRDSCCASGSSSYVSSATNLTTLPGTWAGSTSYNAGPVSAYSYSASGDTAAPTAPAGLKTTGATQSSVSLSWSASSDNVGVTGYGVYVNGALSGNTTGTTYTASGLACGSTYTFSVDAVDAAGNRSAKTSASGTTSACTSSSGSVFVSPSGSDASSCTSAAPCKSFDRAYRVANAGQTVSVAGGSYPSQTLSGDSSKNGPGLVTFQPAAGATVNVSGLYVEGASYVTFSGINAGTRVQVQNTNPSVAGSTNVTFKSVTAQTIRIVGRVSNITISGGSYGSTVDNQPQVKKYNQTDSDSSRPTNILVDGAYFHDFTRSGSTVHTECFQILNANTITIRNSRFNNCDGTGDIGITDGPTDNLTVENNFLGSAGDAYFAVQITKSTRNLVFRNNSASKAIIFSDTESGGPYKLIGNYMPYNASTCTSGATYSHDVFAGGKCGSTDVQVASMRFVDAANFNLHLASGSEAIDRGDPASYPASDIDGQARPLGGAPDAGADEAG